MKNIKYKVTVYNLDKTDSKIKYFRTTDEICEFLGIEQTTYQSFVLNRLKLTVPKTQFLQYVNIEKLSEEEKVRINKLKIKQSPKEIIKNKLDELFDKM